MKTFVTALLLGFLLSFSSSSAAQDASGEYSKAMDAYKNYDFEKSCRRMSNFYGASKGFHDIPADVQDAMKRSGKSEASYIFSAQQAENSHEPAIACTEYFLQALFFAMNNNWLREEKAYQAAMLQREKMIEASDPNYRRPAPDTSEEAKGSSLSDVVEAAKANSSSSCATDQMMMRDKSLIPTCVNHLLTIARKQKTARQWTIARINYTRAAEVNRMLGAKLDGAVANETSRAIREIDAARRTAR